MHGKNTRKLPVLLSLPQIRKMSCFSFYLLYFFFYKIREQEGRTGSAEVGGVGTSKRGKVMGERGRRMNFVQMLDTHVCKYKNGIC
jgi:hypothetical protein